MKNLLLNIMVALLYISANGQKIKEIDTLKYDQMIDKSEVKNFRNGMDINTYLAIDKNSYKVGDTLIIGNPSGINTTETFGGVDTRYEYLLYGKPAGMLLKGIRYVEGNYRGYKLIITKIQFNKGSMGTENYVFFYTTPEPNKKFTTVDEVITITMVDNALDRGEILALYENRPMTRDDAIAYLKMKKEELDLQIISQAEYDKIKNELMPILKNN